MYTLTSRGEIRIIIPKTLKKSRQKRLKRFRSRKDPIQL